MQFRTLIVLSVATCLTAISVVDMYGLINILYLKADKDANGMITIAELDDVFNGFDLNHDGTVSKQEFVSFWQLLTHQTQEHAEAFFYLADLNDDNVIDKKDLGPMYHVFDLDGNGNVTAQEFGKKWMNIIRETPFAVLFERSDADRNNILSATEFGNFFITFDTDKDQQVSKLEMETAWNSNGFSDTVKDADILFAKLDNNHDGFLTGSSDMKHWFAVYDTNPSVDDHFGNSCLFSTDHIEIVGDQKSKNDEIYLRKSPDNHQVDILEVVKMVSLLPPVKLQ